MTTNRIVSHAEWIAARKELLKREKAFTRQRLRPLIRKHQL